MTAQTSRDVELVGFLTGHGGDANQMLLLGEGLHRRGWRVRITVPHLDTSVQFAERCAELGIECRRSRLVRADLTGPRQSPLDMARLVRSLRAPIVHFHTGNSCLPRSLMIALQTVRRQRTFVTIQSPYELLTPGSSRARVWAGLTRTRCHAVVSPSDHGSAYQRTCGVRADRTVTIRNSIDVARMSSGDGHGPRAELGLDDDDPLIVFTSRMDPQKRPVDAVEIFARIAAEHPRAVLAFVGSGSESEPVASRAAELGLGERVKLVGFRTDVENWLAAATVWLLPTERENFSVAVLEALAAGCAVLSTPCPGNDEVLVGGRNASVFAIGDIDGGASHLRELLSNPALRAELSASAVLAASEFTVERMVDNYVELYGRFGLLPATTS